MKPQEQSPAGNDRATNVQSWGRMLHVERRANARALRRECKPGLRTRREVSVLSEEGGEKTAKGQTRGLCGLREDIRQEGLRRWRAEVTGSYLLGGFLTGVRRIHCRGAGKEAGGQLEGYCRNPA